jgi:hypothetical protein
MPEGHGVWPNRVEHVTQHARLCRSMAMASRKAG